MPPRLEPWLIAAGVVGAVLLGKEAMGPMNLKGFVTRLKPDALAAAKTKGWPTPAASDMIITQAVHESGAQRAQGPSDLALKHNNLFGITAELGTFWRTKNYPYVDMPTTEWKTENGKSVSYKTTRPFRKYDTWAASVADWARMISTMPIYAKAAEGLKTGNYSVFMKGLGDAGYATDPDYETKLAGLLRIVTSYTS